MAREIMASAMRDVYNIIRRRREKLGTCVEEGCSASLCIAHEKKT